MLKMMNKHIQIGAGSKTLDRISFISGSAILLALLIFSFGNNSLGIAALIFGTIHLINITRISRKYYVFLQGDHFIVDHFFKRAKVIEKVQYNRVSQDPMTIPFSNVLVIHFKNGDRYRIQGGLSTASTLNIKIKEYLSRQ
jgi:hypothetical protein